MRTPRGGTPLRERRSSITFVDDNSRQGSDVFDDQRFGGAPPAADHHACSSVGGTVLGTLNSGILEQHISAAARTLAISNIKKQWPTAAA